MDAAGMNFEPCLRLAQINKHVLLDIFLILSVELGIKCSCSFSFSEDFKIFFTQGTFTNMQTQISQSAEEHAVGGKIFHHFSNLFCC